MLLPKNIFTYFFSPVLEGLLVMNICGKFRESLPGDHISAIPFIPHAGRYAGCRPFQITQIRLLAELREGVCDLLGGVSIQIV